MSDAAKSLNLIGAGRVGRTLGALWSQHRTFEIHDVLSRTPESAQTAVSFMKAGRPVERLALMRPADVWLIATPDAQIAAYCDALADAQLLREHDVVFHCSGSLSASELTAAATRGAHVASVHPLKTFADPAEAVRAFTGTYCVAEGDRAALATLAPAFEAIGGRFAEIPQANKPLYHAAGVIVCNDLVALLESGLRCYEKAGLDRATALPMMESLVRETVENVFRMGTARALTGPISRGDFNVVAQHLQHLQAWSDDMAGIYRALGMIAVELARESQVDGVCLDRIASLLCHPER
jgi:predicted short-subunit dehydrogenase-like oxidoreductase (DUF2520 family)